MRRSCTLARTEQDSTKASTAAKRGSYRAQAWGVSASPPSRPVRAIRHGSTSDSSRTAASRRSGRWETEQEWYPSYARPGCRVPESRRHDGRRLCAFAPSLGVLARNPTSREFLAQGPRFRRGTDESARFSKNRSGRLPPEFFEQRVYHRVVARRAACQALSSSALKASTIVSRPSGLALVFGEPQAHSVARIHDCVCDGLTRAAGCKKHCEL